MGATCTVSQTALSVPIVITDESETRLTPVCWFGWSIIVGSDLLFSKSAMYGSRFDCAPLEAPGKTRVTRVAVPSGYEMLRVTFASVAVKKRKFT